MNIDEIISEVKSLGWPKGSYIVFGSCPMAAAGIRESSDIDFLVSNKLFAKLKHEGWKQLEKGPKLKPLVLKDLEAYDNWEFPSYNPTLEQLLESADIIDGIPFVNLNEVRKWKSSLARPKDLKDIKLIDEYLAPK